MYCEPAALASPSGAREIFCQDSPCALTLCASNGARACEKFVLVEINACLELAPVSNKRRVNRPPKKIDARAFNRGNTVYMYTAKEDNVRCYIMLLIRNDTPSFFTIVIMWISLYSWTLSVVVRTYVITSEYTHVLRARRKLINIRLCNSLAAS